MGAESAERLVGMLGPARAQLDATGRCAHALTPQDVAAGLAKCSDTLGAALLQARVTGSFRYIELENGLHARLLDRALHDGWRVHSKRGIPRTLDGQLRAMLRLALTEFLRPEQCPRCRGRKKIQPRNGAVPRDCPRCNGVGHLVFPARALAREFGITAPAWKKVWANRYRSIQAWLHDLYGTAEGDVARALR